MALQNIWQFHMLLQFSNVTRFQLFDTPFIDRVNVFTSEAGRIDQSVDIRVFFYGPDGVEVGVQDISVPVPAADMREVFRVEIDTDQDVVAYRYEVISEP